MTHHPDQAELKAELRHWFFQKLDVQQRNGFFVALGFHSPDAELPLGMQYQALEQIAEAIAAWNTCSTDNPPAGDVVERVAEAITRARIEHGWNWLKLAEAALSVRSGETWLPIDSAPRLGSVLVYEPTREWVTVGYQENGCWSDERAEDEPIFPTHWQPLPAPPALNEQEGCQSGIAECLQILREEAENDDPDKRTDWEK